MKNKINRILLSIAALSLMSCNDQSNVSSQYRTDDQSIRPQRILDSSEGEVAEEPMTPDTITRM